MNREKLAAIEQKIKKAKSFLDEADILFQNRFYATVINRLYYGCFHITKALLLTKDIIPKTHTGVINQLHLHFVQSGNFDMEHAAFFSRLMQERIEDDYSDTIEEDADNTKAFIEPARLYIQYVEQLIFQLVQKD